MNLQQRINLLSQLADYFKVNDITWKEVKHKASLENAWFTEQFIEIATTNIIDSFLDTEKLNAFVKNYKIPAENTDPTTIGLVMAGNIPLVGFHDWLCIFLSGHRAVVKPSSKDNSLIRHIVGKLAEWDAGVTEQTKFAEMLKGCDAYIATGSNNSARYFEYYFSKYRHIIRRNRTSVAILDGNETPEELDRLADDVHLYFGLGCRNVTKIMVPAGYDFVGLLNTFKKYGYFAEHNKYKNNYDYQLAIVLLNNQYYMTNGSILLLENNSLFSPISQLNYEFYGTLKDTQNNLQNNKDIQCVIGKGGLKLGISQQPGLADFADGVDTMQFLMSL